MICNIDQKGKHLRYTAGLALAAAGIILLTLWALPWESLWAWVISIILLATGLFMVFEARAGWCALRAMGIKTRI